MNIDDLTISQAKKLVTMFCTTTTKPHSFEIGKMYLIRTVTMIQVGRIIEVTDSDILLEDAAWVADTGRFYDALKNGDVDEVEPFPFGCIVSRAAIVDASPWRHAPLREQK